MSRKISIGEALTYLRNKSEDDALDMLARDFLNLMEDCPQDVKTAFIDYLISMRHVQSIETREAFKGLRKEE